MDGYIGWMDGTNLDLPEARLHLHAFVDVYDLSTLVEAAGDRVGLGSQSSAEHRHCGGGGIG